MKKILAIILALALVMGSTPGFSQESGKNPYDKGKGSGENLKEYGFIDGNESGDLMESAAIDRQQMSIVLARINGKSDEAKAFAKETDFKDKADFPAWSKNYIAYAVDQGWFAGYSDGRFGHEGKMSSEMLATVLLKVLGYESDWGKNYARLLDLGAKFPNKDELNRGEAFQAIWPVVSLPIMKSGKILGVELGLLKEIKAEEKFELKDITIKNLKEVEMTFTMDVLLAGIKDNAKMPTGVAIDSVTHGDDKKTVVVALKNALTNGKEYEFEFKNISAETISKSVDVKKKLAALDREVPEVESINFVGSRTIEVVFSEPIKTAGTFTLKQGATTLSIDSAKTTGVGTRKMVYSAFSDLTEGKEYTISVTDHKDYAGNSNVAKLETKKFIKDSTSAVATIFKSTPDYVGIEFSRPVKGLKKENFYHTFPGYIAKYVTKTDSRSTSIPSTEFVTRAYIWFTSKPYAPTTDRPLNGKVEFHIKGSAGIKIKDGWGNVLPDTEHILNVVADKTAPKISAVTFIQEDKIEIKFDREVKFSSANLSVLNADGTSISGLTTAVMGSGKSFNVSLNKKLTGQTVMVNIKGVVDTSLFKNKMADYSTTITVGDKTAPKVLTASYTNVTGQNYIYLTFDEALDDTKALLKDNYQVVSGASYTKVDGVIELMDNNIVRITITKAEATALAGKKIFVDGVTDLAGNEITVKMHDLVPHAGVSKVAVVGSAKAIAKNKLELTFNMPIKAFPYDASNSSQNALTTTNGHKVEDIEIKGHTVIVHLTGDVVDPDGNVVDFVDIKKDMLIGSLSDKANNDADSVNILHAIPLNLKSTNALSRTENSKRIVIDFNTGFNSIGIDEYKFANDISLKIGGYELNPISSDFTVSFVGHSVYVDIANSVQAEGEIEISYKNSEYLKSLSDKKLESFTAQTLSGGPTGDFKGPEILSITYRKKGGHHLLDVVFNEELDQSSAEGAGNYTGTGFIVTNANLNSDKKSVILTLNEKPENDDTMEVKYVKDQAYKAENSRGNNNSMVTTSYKYKDGAMIKK